MVDIEKVRVVFEESGLPSMVEDRLFDDDLDIADLSNDELVVLLALFISNITFLIEHKIERNQLYEYKSKIGD